MRCCGVCKFFAGFFASATLTSWYFAYHKIAIPFMGYEISPYMEGVKAVVFLILFLLFFYWGFLKKKDVC